MVSAVYYPHTTLHDDSLASQRLLKRSLLLWDELEFIVPARDFRPVYNDKLIARAMELIGRNHYPSGEEKKKAHEQIEELVTRPHLPEVFYSQGPDADAYDIYPDKLLPETWDIIRRSKLAIRPGPQPPGAPGPHFANAGPQAPAEGDFIRAGRRYEGYEGYLSTTGQAGLAVMDILADCCAGTTRSRVTDRSGSYKRLTSLLAEGTSESQFVIAWSMLLFEPRLARNY